MKNIKIVDIKPDNDDSSFWLDKKQKGDIYTH